MKIIKIKKSGKICLEELDENKSKVITVKSLKENLACEVEFESGLTFGTFFKLILKDKDFFDIVFSQELNGKKLQDFEDEMKLKPKSHNEDFKLEYLEISKIFELFTFDKYSTIDLFSVFVGLGKTNDGFDVFIPLSFYSVNELKNLEIFENKIVEVYKDMQFDGLGQDEEDYDEDYEEDENENLAPCFQSSTRITLYEAIQGIIFEISYHGKEEDRLNARKNQNDDYISKGKISILEAQLEKHIETEEYEKAAITKRELDKLKSIGNKNNK